MNGAEACDFPKQQWDSPSSPSFSRPGGEQAQERQAGDSSSIQPQGTVSMNVALELCRVAVLRKRGSAPDGVGCCVLSLC